MGWWIGIKERQNPVRAVKPKEQKSQIQRKPNMELHSALTLLIIPDDPESDMNLGSGAGWWKLFHSIYYSRTHVTMFLMFYHIASLCGYLMVKCQMVHLSRFGRIRSDEPVGRGLSTPP